MTERKFQKTISDTNTLKGHKHGKFKFLSTSSGEEKMSPSKQTILENRDFKLALNKDASRNMFFHSRFFISSQRVNTS